MKAIHTTVLALAAAMLLAGCERKMNVAWECRVTNKNAAQCRFENKGEVRAEACFDMVQVCGGKDHVGSICSGPIPVGGVENKVIREFSPPVGMFERCDGIEYRNKSVTASR
jgi:hypothetical protein